MKKLRLNRATVRRIAAAGVEATPGGEDTPQIPATVVFCFTLPDCVPRKTLDTLTCNCSWHCYT